MLIFDLKNTLIISFILFCCLGFAQQHKRALIQEQTQHTASDTLHWNNDHKLTWDDFQGKQDDSINAAITVAAFTANSKYLTDSTISVVVNAVFYKSESWVNKEHQTSYNLNHEQKHFDIAEVYARKANAELKKYKFNRPTVINDIQKIFDYYSKERDKMQEIYDKETTFPKVNSKKQKEWDAKVHKWLQERKY